ncbi:hypothetical protein HN865_04925 [Candidatus Woesearchaeota archaeon]|nr:hypothetical protein [Candidatus Woesearchaeota archaeon]MBT7238167.1 hypothetical protein [Candidatus Woesearchaeota archaeon]
MTLEKKLSQIECLASDLDSRFSNGRGDFPIYLRGIVSEARLLEKNYHNAKSALKTGSQEEASEHISAFGMDTKNLADNLNRVMQVLYGGDDKKIEDLRKSMKETIRGDLVERSLYTIAYMKGIRPDLRKLETNTRDAPDLDDEGKLSDYFMENHDINPETPSMIARNWKGHGDGHSVVHEMPEYPSGYVVGNMDTIGADFPEIVDAGEFLDDVRSKYLDMATVILDTISLKDQEHFKGEQNLPSLFRRRFSNFMKRNKNELRFGLYRAGVGISIAMLLAANINLREKTHKLEEEQKLRGTVEHYLEVESGIRDNYDNWEISGNHKVYEEIMNRRIDNWMNAIGTTGLDTNNIYVKEFLEDNPVLSE